MIADGDIPLGQYLWLRLASIGIQHVFGVPGDFNLALADELYNVPALKWVGVCNELNGAYAADGYTRLKGHPAAFLTTYAVGELSAINGVAGAYAEHAGMIHIVGMPSRHQQRTRPLLHHTLGPGMDQTNTFVNMAGPVRCAHTVLMEESKMAGDIDSVIIQCMKSRLPAYIYVPMDVVSIPVDASRLRKPLDTSVHNSDKQKEDTVVRKVLERMKSSQRPAVLVDVLAMRHGCQDLVQSLVDITAYPTFSAPIGKGTVDESKAGFRGIYQGKVSFEGIQNEIEAKDLVLSIGPLPTAANTGGFSRQLSEQAQVVLGHDHCQIGDEKYEGVHFRPVLERLVEALRSDAERYSIPYQQLGEKSQVPLLESSTTGKITQAYIWQRIGRFLRPNDMLFVEAGTAQFGSMDMTLPTGVAFNTQMMWSSIGYSVGAGLGGCVAAKELKSPGRVIVLVGEGSLQMTVQEIGSYIRYGFKPIIFVVNNDGYAIERAIGGSWQKYNDLGQWDYQKMLEFFGANAESGNSGRSHLCRTKEDVEAVLNDENFATPQSIQMCELRLESTDYPWRLSTLVSMNRPKENVPG